MTKLEFDEWLAFHFSRFTGCTGWLGKFPTTPRFTADPTQKSIIDGWREILIPADLKHAKMASQLLAVGEETFPDRGYDCHPSTVRRIAIRMAGVEQADQKRKVRIVQGEEVFDCKIGCKDSGILTLWHPTALRFFKDVLADDPPHNWYGWWNDPRAKELSRRAKLYESCVVLCTCEIGLSKKSSAPRYDESRHVIWDGDPRNAIEKFSQTPGGGWGLDGDF